MVWDKSHFEKNKHICLKKTKLLDLEVRQPTQRHTTHLSVLFMNSEQTAVNIEWACMGSITASRRIVRESRSVSIKPEPPALSPLADVAR